jgi:hypothetical protein
MNSLVIYGNHSLSPVSHNLPSTTDRSPVGPVIEGELVDIGVKVLCRGCNEYHSVVNGYLPCCLCNDEHSVYDNGHVVCCQCSHLHDPEGSCLGSQSCGQYICCIN